MSTPHVVYSPRYLIQKSQYACRIVLILVLWTSPRFRFHTFVIVVSIDQRSRAGEGGRKKIGWSDFAPLVPFFLEIKDISIAVDRVYPVYPSIGTMGTVLRRRFAADWSRRFHSAQRVPSRAPSLRAEFSRASPIVRRYRDPFSRSQGTTDPSYREPVWLTPISSRT